MDGLKRLTISKFFEIRKWKAKRRIIQHKNIS